MNICQQKREREREEKKVIKWVEEWASTVLHNTPSSSYSLSSTDVLFILIRLASGLSEI